MGIIGITLWLFSCLVFTVLSLVAGIYFIRIPREPNCSIKNKFPKFSFTDPRIWDKQTRLIKSNQELRNSKSISKLSQSFDEVGDFIIRDFINTWFQYISTDQSFPNEIRIQLKLAITELESRIYVLDAARLLVIEILPLFTQHYITFVKASETVVGENFTPNGSAELDLKIASEYNSIKKLHPYVTLKSSDNETENRSYSRQRMKKIVPFLISSDEASSPAASILIRELLANAVILPTIKLLTDCDFWNQTLVNVVASALKDRDQVRELRKSIDEQYSHPESKGEISVALANNPLLANKITPQMRQPDFEKYLKVITKCDSMPLLKQLKYYVAVQISRTHRISSKSDKFLKYSKRLLIAKNILDRRLDDLGSFPENKRQSVVLKKDLDNFITNLSLEQILSNPASLSFFMEFMEQRSRTVLLQYWLTVNGIKDPLENPSDPEYEHELSSSVDMTGINDVKQIFHLYFDKKLLRIDATTYKEVKAFADGTDDDIDQYVKVRKLVLLLQSDVFRRMEKTDLSDFKNSDLFLKLLANDGFEESLVNEVDFITEPGEERSESDIDQEPSLEEIENALNQIMQEKRETNGSDLKSSLNKGFSEERSRNKGASSLNHVLKQDLFGDTNKTFLDEKPKLFEEDEKSTDEGDDESLMDFVPDFFTPSHNALNLKEEISSLDEQINKLNQQSHMLDPLILKAELINNTNELRILRKSKMSYEREIEAKELTKQQLIIQDNDNSLFGKTNVSIDTWVKGKSDGRDYILYIIEVQKRDTSDEESSTGWIIGRRFSQFYKLNEILKLKYPQVNDLPFPKKKIILRFQQKALIDERSVQLESYLRKLLELREVCEDRNFRKFLTTQDFKSETPLSDSQTLQPSIPPTIPEPTPSSSILKIEDAANKFYSGISNGLEKLNPKAPISNENAEPAKIEERDPPTSSFSASPNPEVVEDMQKELEVFNNEVIKSEPNRSFIKPVTDLAMALFALNRSNTWLRGKAMIVVLQQIFGSTIEKRIKEMINGFTTEDKVLGIINTLKDTIWPNGELMKPSEPRTLKEKMKTKHEAELLLEKFLLDSFSKLVGQSSAKSASKRIHSMLQNDLLNTNLVYEITDKILELLFPEVRNNL